MKIREIMQDPQRAPLFLVSCGLAALAVAIIATGVAILLTL